MTRLNYPSSSSGCVNRHAISSAFSIHTTARPAFFRLVGGRTRHVTFLSVNTHDDLLL